MIVVGFTKPLSQATLDTLSLFPHQLTDVSGSDSDYFELLRSWWVSSEEDVITLEHDIEPQPQLIQELLDCHRPWCAALYDFENRHLFGLGLTKFNRVVRASVPDLFEQIAPIANENHPPKHWCTLDAHSQNILHMQSGHAAHLHDHPEWIKHTSTIRGHVGCRPSQ